MRGITTIVPLILVVAAFAGCAGDAPENSPTTTTPTPPAETKREIPTISFGVTESHDEGQYTFTGPETVAAGWVTLELKNDGMEPHVMVLMRLLENKTYEDALAALAGGEEPTWVEEAGGVSIVSPGVTSSVTQQLTEGAYFMFCWVNGHMMQGMTKPLNVTAAPAGTQTAPVPAFTVTLDEFSFAFDKNITAGKHVIAVKNVGKQPHEAPFVDLDEGVSMMEFAEAMESEAGGPPPGKAIGGVNAIKPGETVYATITFEKGNHGLICFVSDEDDPEHAPHVFKGMLDEFEVA